MAETLAPKPTHTAPRARALAAPERAPVRPPVHSLARLQRSIGNRAVGAFLQTKLRVGPVDDHYEREADATATTVMRSATTSPAASPVQRSLQRCACGGSCESCRDRDATTVQASSIHGAESSDVAPEVEARLEATRGRGTSLPPQSRSFMESRFGRDFSSVRVHTGPSAESLSHDLNAHAFTAGTDIYFGAGEFRPGTTSGDHLLAHELTHVVQQNPNIRRVPLRQAPPAAGGSAPVQHEVIQRKPYFLAPSPLPKGTKVHDDILKLFLTSANPGLFIEAPIPGAKKNWWAIGPESQGRADFYMGKDSTGTPRTVGLKMTDENIPAYISAPGLQWEGGAYNHDTTAGPLGATTTPRVRHLANAVHDAKVGDLKPAESAESFLGRGQVNDYLSGISNTADAVNAYVKKNPKESDAGAGVSWKVTTAPLDTLKIPPEVTYPGGGYFPHRQLHLYDQGFAKPKWITATQLTGGIFVYKDDIPGIYAYEYIPDNAQVVTAHPNVNAVLDHLNTNVIPRITAAPDDGLVPRKAKSAAPLVAPTTTKLVYVQREPKKFSDEEWQTKSYKPWKLEAETVLGDKEAIKQATVAEALVDIEERSHKNLGLSDDVKKQGKAVDKITHWQRWGGIYGWLREKLDFIFVKFHKMSKWVKDKVAKLMKSKAVSTLAGWVKMVAQTIFKIFKMLASWTIRSVVDKVVHSLSQGISANLSKLAEMATPDGVKGKLEDFENLKQTYSDIVEKKEEEISTFLFGDHLALFETIAEFESVASDASTIASLVEWGIRLLACASPPAIGCLWNLAIQALEYFFGLLMQTCWFTKKVYKPVIDYVDIVRNFPKKVAAKVVSVANKYIPYPDGFKPWFSDITIGSDEFDPDCKDSGESGGESASPEREAILDLVQAVGDAKVKAMMEIAKKRGAGPWALLSVERIKAMEDALRKAELKDLQDAAKDPSTKVPASLEDVLADMGKYTPKEEAVKKKFFEDKAKADAAKEAAKQAAGGKGGQADAGNAAVATDKGKDKGPAGGGGTAGTVGTGGVPKGVIVLDASKYTIDSPEKNFTMNPAVKAYVIGAKPEHAKKAPDLISADIFVNGVHRYRVENVRVSGTFGTMMLSTPTTFVIVYYLEPGLKLNVDGQDVYWTQFSKTVFAEP
jgi:hypothetical protein